MTIVELTTLCENKSPGKVLKAEPAVWTVFQTLIGDLNFVSKSVGNFQSSLKLFSGLMDTKNTKNFFTLNFLPKRKSLLEQEYYRICFWNYLHINTKPFPTFQYWRIRMQVWKLILHMLYLLEMIPRRWAGSQEH